jgi:hypothetical protein
VSRIRQLKPGFFQDEDLAELGPWHRLLFQGLWVIADRKGRLEDRPAFIRVQVFPYDNLEAQKVSVHDLLGDLAKARKHSPDGGGFIRRYVVDGRPYIQIRNFEKHQKPHMNEVDSQIPSAPALTGEALQTREMVVQTREMVVQASTIGASASTIGASASTIGASARADSRNGFLVLGTDSREQLQQQSAALVVETVAKRHVACFNAVFGRELSVTPDTVRKTKALLAEKYRPWQVVSLPILVESHGLGSGFRKRVNPEILLRDGKHPRTSNGQTYGGTHWLERELGRIDQAVLTPRLADIAQQFEVLDPLMKSGVGVREDSGL